MGRSLGLTDLDETRVVGRTAGKNGRNVLNVTGGGRFELVQRRELSAPLQHTAKNGAVCADLLRFSSAAKMPPHREGAGGRRGPSVGNRGEKRGFCD